MKATMVRQCLPIIILVTFVLVAAFSFVHFYSMLSMGMQGGGHSACAAYSQISECTPPPNQNLIISMIAISFVLILGRLIDRAARNISFFWFNNRWRVNSFSPQLLQIFLFRKGILNPKLYA